MKKDILYAKCIRNTKPDFSHVKYDPATFGAFPETIGETIIDELEIGKLYEVTEINMGQSYTSIYLAEFGKMCYNSVLFEFYKNNKLYNIYNDPKYNPYI